MILIDYSQILCADISVLDKGLGASITGREVRGAVACSIRMLVNTLGEQYGTPILCCDRPHTWRREHFPNYKWARRNNTNEDNPRSIHNIIERNNLNGIEYEFRDAFGWPVVAVEGAEGDDVIASLAFAYDETKGNGSFFTQMNEQSLLCEPSVIVSMDKDFDQLGDIIDIFNQKRHEMTKPDPKLALRTLILRGDSGDGVPSINCPDDYFTVSSDVRKRQPVTAKQSAMFPEVLTEEVIMSICPDKINNYRRNDLMVNLRKIPVKVRQDVLREFEAQVAYTKDHKPDPMAFCVRWGLLKLLSD